MVWVKIKKIVDSRFNDSKIAYFDYFDEERFAVISPTVLKYLKVSVIEDTDEIYIVKSFNNEDKEVYFIKNVRKSS